MLQFMSPLQLSGKQVSVYLLWTVFTVNSRKQHFKSTGRPTSTAVDIDVHTGNELADFIDNQHLGKTTL